MEAPHTPKKYRYMKRVQLCHLYDLPRIRAYIWQGDQGWAAGLAGVSGSFSYTYLSGRGSPSQASTKLLWRLLLAKSLNNKSYAAAVALHSKPVSSKTLRAARSALLPHDHGALGTVFRRAPDIYSLRGLSLPHSDSRGVASYGYSRSPAGRPIIKDCFNKSNPG